MMSDLRPGDRLVPAHRPEAYWEVLDGRSHSGTIHVFDALERNAQFVEEAEVRAELSAGTLVLRRQGMARVGIAAQHEDQALQARAQWLYEVLRRIEVLRVELGLSFDAAAKRAREQYQREHADQAQAMAFPSRATLYRTRRNQRLGLPVLKGHKNKGNLTPRYPPALVEFIQTIINEQYLVTASRCIDPAVFAQVRLLKHKPQRGSSCPAPGAGAGGCKSRSNPRSRGWHAAGSRTCGGEHIGP